MSVEYITLRAKEDERIDAAQASALANEIALSIHAGRIPNLRINGINAAHDMRDQSATNLARIWPVGLSKTTYNLRIYDADGKLQFAAPIVKDHDAKTQFMKVVQWTLGIVFSIALAPLALALYISLAVKAKGAKQAFKQDLTAFNAPSETPSQSSDSALDDAEASVHTPVDEQPEADAAPRVTFAPHLATVLNTPSMTTATAVDTTTAPEAEVAALEAETVAAPEAETVAAPEAEVAAPEADGEGSRSAPTRRRLL